MVRPSDKDDFGGGGYGRGGVDRDGEPLRAAQALDFERRHQLVHLVLDRLQPDHLLEAVQRLIERAFRGNDGLHLQPAPGAYRQ